jgi:hypothetical protein
MISSVKSFLLLLCSAAVMVVARKIVLLMLLIVVVAQMSRRFEQLVQFSLLPPEVDFEFAVAVDARDIDRQRERLLAERALVLVQDAIEHRERLGARQARARRHHVLQQAAIDEAAVELRNVVGQIERRLQRVVAQQQRAYEQLAARERRRDAAAAHLVVCDLHVVDVAHGEVRQHELLVHAVRRLERAVDKVLVEDRDRRLRLLDARVVAHHGAPRINAHRHAQRLHQIPHPDRSILDAKLTLELHLRHEIRLCRLKLYRAR